MSLKAGIVGLPNVGKSTLFNAITKQNILAANYPFATIEPNVGMVFVPDTRVEFLKNMYNPKSVVPTTFEFTDIAGLVAGASKGEGLGNKFLSHIREVDAVVEVVRCFDDENIIHVDGSVDPIRDIEVINVELVLSDLEIVTSRINKIGKKAMTTKNKDDVKGYATKLEQKNLPLFYFVYDSLVWFDGAHEGIANFHLLFLMRLSFYMGIGPNLSEGLEQSKYFDLDEGKFVPFVPAHSHYLSESDSFHLLQMFRLDYKTMHLYKMSRQERNHSVEVMIEYYRLHIPGFPELKSLSVLQELFC